VQDGRKMRECGAGESLLAQWPARTILADSDL